MRFIPLLTALFWAGFLCAQTPNNIEAVEYDPAGNRWFVSNGSSLLVTQNQGADWAFFGEAQASHGMEVMGDVLYAIGSNVIRAYSLDNAEELGALVIPGVGFLNGLGSDGNGTLVVSDFSGGRLYTVDATEPQQMSHSLLAGNFGETPNGVVMDPANNRAIVVCWGGNAPILAVDLESGDVTPLVDGTGLGNLDGIDDDGNGAYYVSSWSPTRITRYTDNFSQSETVVTGAGGLSNPADISYAIALDTLGVANSGNNAVTFHGFSTAGTGSVANPELHATRLGSSTLMVGMPMAGLVSVRVVDVTGRTCMERTEWLPSGQVRFPLGDIPASALVVIEALGTRTVVR